MRIALVSSPEASLLSMDYLCAQGALVNPKFGDRKLRCSYRLTERGQLKVYNRIVRSSLSLGEAERLTLLFVLDRTIGWQKVLKAISHAEFLNGVFRKKAGHRRLVVHGTGLSWERVCQAIHSLEGMGAIRVHRLGSADVYEINDDWCHPDLPREGACKVWDLNESDYIGESDAWAEG